MAVRLINLPMIVAAAVAAMACAGPVPPGAPTSTGPPAPATTTAARRPYAVDPSASEIGIYAGSWLGSHPIRVERYQAQADVDERVLERSRVEVELDLTTVKAERAWLTDLMKSPRILDVERFPTARFVSLEIRRLPEVDRFLLLGELTLHGTTRRLSVEASIARRAGAFIAEGRFGVRRQDFGIEPGGLLDLVVDDEVVVELRLVARPAPTPAAQQPVLDTPEP